MINYEDFKKLEIKIGEIVSAEKIESSEKLVKLMVDIGEEEPRQIIAGISPYFEDISEIAGKQITILANLEPRKLMGYESQGMLLAVGDGENFSLIGPHNKVKNGTIVT